MLQNKNHSRLNDREECAHFFVEQRTENVTLNADSLLQSRAKVNAPPYFGTLGQTDLIPLYRFRFIGNGTILQGGLQIVQCSSRLQIPPYSLAMNIYIFGTK